MKHLAFPLACAVAVIGSLSGCQTTMDARWATHGDTVNRWEAAGPNLPIEVRGELPNISNQQIARSISNASSQNSVASVPAARFVLELGSPVPVAGDNYCAAHDAAQPVSHATEPVTITLSLCDGTRLVARSSAPLDATATAEAHLKGNIEHLKNLLFIGLADNQAQSTEIQG